MLVVPTTRIIRKDEPAGVIAGLLSRYNAFVRQQFNLFLQSVQDSTTLNAIIDALRDNNITRAFGIVDTYVVRLGSAIVSMMPIIGRAQAQITAADAGLGGAGVAINFNPASPQIVEAMRQNQLEFVTDFSNDQRLVVASSLAQSMQEGVGTVVAARRIRDVVGLTSYQQGMVDRYRSLLETNNRRALDYVLRDRRYDTGFENALEENEYLPPGRIDLMVQRYKDRLLQLRGETIARTETARVAEEARVLGLEQSIEQADVSRTRVVKEWVAQLVRTRDTHREMNGQARLLDDPFDSPSGAQLMQPGDRTAPASESINCRCSVRHHIFQSEDEAQQFLIANGQGKYN